jgi:hypothetical protein
MDSIISSRNGVIVLLLAQCPVSGTEEQGHQSLMPNAHRDHQESCREAA